MLTKINHLHNTHACTHVRPLMNPKTTDQSPYPFSPTD